MEKDYQTVETQEVVVEKKDSTRGHWDAYENIDMIDMATVEYVKNWSRNTTLDDLKRKVEESSWSAISISNMPNMPHAALKSFPYQLEPSHCGKGYNNTLWIYTPPYGQRKPVLETKAATRPSPNLHCQREVRSDRELSDTNCCSFSKPYPPRVENVDGVDQRIYINFQVESYCSSSYPLSKGVVQSTPAQLLNKGVTDEQWKDHVQRLCKVNNMRGGYFSLFIPGWIVACTTPFLLPLYCRWDGSGVKAWDGALRKWQDDFNEECLIPLGMFCKTQSNSWVTSGSSDEGRGIARWTAFALTPESAIKLRVESHLIGVIDDCYSKYCGAYPEGKCCIHPRN